MLLPSILITLTLAQPPAKPFEFKDGDRIVWIGNTFVEREQRYGYWESALLVANKDKKITFRNLGWSGDTVFGDARAGFDNADKGFERLVSLTLELKPTVIFVSYGTNEAFEGKEGLGKFERGLEKLLDALEPAKARMVLFTPMPFEPSKQYPNSRRQNAMLEEYAKIIRKVSATRGHYLADLFAKVQAHLSFLQNITLSDPSLKMDFSGIGTENGMHLTEEGYEIVSPILLASLGSKYPSETDLVKGLLKAVVAKNQLFFYRWRPQNETYLFGFRKHEQGKNAKEVAEFDPLVGKAEEEIQAILKSTKK
jgi:lysophospholipase L1-like esterase